MSLSEKKQSADSSVRSRYERMLDNLAVGCKIVDFGYRYIYMNDAAADFLKLNREESLGKKITELFKDFEKKIIYEIIKRCMEDRKERAIDEKIEYPDGTYRWMKTTFMADPEGVFVTLEDITQAKKRDEAGKKLERQLSGAMEMAHLGYWEYDVKNDLFTFNDQFYYIYKTTVEEVGGYYMSSEEYAKKFIYPEDRSIVPDEIGRLVDIDDPDFNVNVEHRIIYGDGGVGYISVKYFIEKDSDGKIVRTYGVNQDITDRIKAEEALRVSHERLTNLASQVPGMLYQLVKKEDGSFSIPYSSQNVEDLFGCRPGDLTSDYSPILNVVHSDDRQKLSESIRESAANLSQWKCEYRVQLPGKPVKWIYGNSIPEKMDDGSIVWSGYNVDITDSKNVEEELRLNQERMQAILEASPDPVIVYDDKGKATFINPSFTRLFGWTANELLGKKIPFVPESEEKITFETISKLLNNSGTISLETRRLTKDGNEIEVLANAASINDLDGNSVGLVVNLTDLSQIKKMEEQLRQAQRIESIGRLAGGVAHDFNNFLGVIIGNVDIALEDVDEGNSIVYNLKEIRKAARHSSDLTRQLLAFARKQTVSPKVLDLNKTIEGMLAILKRLMGESIELLWAPFEKLYTVRIDPSQIDQILANLCVNARDAINGIGKVTIETSNVSFGEDFYWDNEEFKEGEYAMLAVTDNGCGMDRNTLSYLFEPFFTTKEIGHGTGLGLATVYGIVKQNNGLINVYSEEGKGSSFKIYIPRFVESLDKEGGGASEEGDMTGSETVLLVEDDESILLMSKMLLERLGYKVLSAGNPFDAIKIADEYENKIDLFITDVVMPEMNGRELANKILKIHPSMKCLFMSGYTSNVISHHGMLDDGIQFINKPFTKNELAKKIREVFEAD